MGIFKFFNFIFTLSSYILFIKIWLIMALLLTVISYMSVEHIISLWYSDMTVHIFDSTQKLSDDKIIIFLIYLFFVLLYVRLQEILKEESIRKRFKIFFSAISPTNIKLLKIFVIVTFSLYQYVYWLYISALKIY